MKSSAGRFFCLLALVCFVSAQTQVRFVDDFLTQSLIFVTFSGVIDPSTPESSVYGSEITTVDPGRQMITGERDTACAMFSNVAVNNVLHNMRFSCGPDNTGTIGQLEISLGTVPGWAILDLDGVDGAAAASESDPPNFNNPSPTSAFTDGQAVGIAFEVRSELQCNFEFSWYQPGNGTPMVSNINVPANTVNLTPFSILYDDVATIADFNSIAAFRIHYTTDNVADSLLRNLITFTNQITGTIWRDCDEDGVLDNGEQRQNNINVNLVQCGTTTVIDTVTTLTDGTYTFGAADGCYDVCIDLNDLDQVPTVPTGFAPVTQQATFTIPSEYASNGPNFDCLQTDIIISGNDSPNNDFHYTLPVVISCPPADTADCSVEGTTQANPGNGVFDNAVAFDCANTVSISFLDTVTATCGGRSRTFTATTSTGNQPDASCAQSITYADTTNPTFTMPNDFTSTDCANVDTSTGNTGTVSNLSDNCNTPAVSDALVQTSPSCPETYERTFTVTDGCGNTVSDTQTITYIDNVGPIFTRPIDASVDCSAGTTPGDTGTVTTCSDACNTCDINTLNIADQSTFNGCTETITRTFTLSDTCGNTASQTQTIIAQDTTPPVVTPPRPVGLDCNDDTSVNALGTAVVTDDCSSNLTPSVSDSPITGDGCTDQFSRTFTATDNCGQTGQGTVTYTITDTTAPTFSVVTPINLECTDSTDPSQIANGNPFSIADDCNIPEAAQNTDQAPVGDSCSNTFNRVWTISDNCGNIGTRTQVIQVTDDVGPTFTVPAPFNAECNVDATDVGSVGTPTATDACSALQGSPVATDAPATGDQCNRQVIRTFTQSDVCGNAGSIAQTITISDTLAPSITVSNVNINCGDNTDSASVGGATALDVCQGDLTNSLTQSTAIDNGNTNGCQTVYLRTWTVSDGCGQISQTTQTITATDNVAPFFTSFPPNVNDVPLCGGDTSPATTGQATADDACTFASVSFTDTPTTNACGQTIQRQWTATDQCGLTTQQTQQIIQTDSDDPVRINNGFQLSVTVGCPATADISVGTLGTPQFSDCSQTTTTNADSTDNGNAPCTVVTTRTFSTTDSCGNGPVLTTQTITATDNILPFFDPFPPTFTGECNGNTDPATTGIPTAQDACTTPTTPTSSDGPVTGTCPQSFARTWTTQDSCGNQFTQTQTISVDDTTPPQFQIQPADTTVNCDQPTDTGSLGMATAIDTCTSNTVPVSVSDSPLTGTCELRTFTRTFTASEVCGGSSQYTQTIQVRDNVQPNAVFPPSTTVTCVECTTASAGCTGVPTGTDNCNAFIVSNTDTTPTGDNCNQSFTRNWSVDDGCGNIATGVQIISITDNLDPSITAPNDVTVQCTESTDPSNTGSPSAGQVTDQCNTATSSFTDSAPSGDINCDYTINRTWLANDGCGNTATDVQVIRVRDTIAPVFDPNSDPIIDQDCTNNSFPSNIPPPTDNCNTPTTTFSDTNQVPGCTVTFTRTYTANDGCGNTSEFTQLWRLIDNGDPSFVTFPADTTVDCSESTDPSNTGGAPTVTDACDPNPTLTQVTTPTGALCSIPELEYERVWTVTDQCGRSVSRTQIIDVTINDVPIISPPDDVTVDCDEGTSTANLGVATVSSPCGVTADITFTDTTISDDQCSTVIARTFTGTDECGRDLAAVTQIISITDSEGPEFTCFPDDVAIPCDGNTSPLALGVPCAADACNLAVCDITYTDNVVQETSDGPCEGDFILTRTWIATDVCGFATQRDQTIDIQVQPVPEECPAEPCDAAPCTPDLCPSVNCDCCNSPLRGCTAIECSPTPCTPVQCTQVDCTPCQGGNYAAPVPFCDGPCIPNYTFRHRDDDDNDDGNSTGDDLYDYFLDDDETDDDDWVSSDDDRFGIIYQFGQLTDGDDDDDDGSGNDDDDIAGNDDGNDEDDDGTDDGDDDDDDDDDDSAVTLSLSSSLVLLALVSFLFI